MKLAQSYYSVVMRGRLSVYEMRLLMHIARKSRALLGAAASGGASVSLSSPLVDGEVVRMAIPVSDIIGRSHNYESMRAAVRRLNSMQIEYYDAQSRVWHLANIVSNVKLSEIKGVVEFMTPSWFVEYVCDEKNGGLRIYDFENAMSLRNAFSSRLYLLTCSLNRPLRYNIPFVKKVLGVEGKYKKFSDFERRVLKPAMKELEERGLNGFTYDVERAVPSKKSSEPVNLVFRPVKREGKRSIEEKKADLQGIPEIILQYLVVSLHFSGNELSGKNSVTIKAFCQLENYEEKFFTIVERARRKQKNHGYIIAAMKREVAAHQKK